MMKNITTIILICFCGMISAQSYKIGDLYTASDGSKGIVYYLYPDGGGGWVVALNDVSASCVWGDATDVPGLANQDPYYNHALLYDTAGYANTQALRSYQNNNTAYAAGTVNFAQGWVLPSPAQLSMLYAQLPFITNAITNAGGTTLAVGNYWASAEYNASKAWCLTVDTIYYYSSGYFNDVSKSTLGRVRAVRSFSNESPQPELSYLWNTGDNTPDITVSPTQTTTYTVTVSSPGGCADTVVHTIVVNNVAGQVFNAVVAQGQGYEGNGFSVPADETASPGTYTFYNASSVSGCEVTDTLYLTVSPEIPLPDNVFEADCVLPADSNAFTMVELFQCGGVNSLSTPLVADMDGDGLPEIIACRNTGSAYTTSGFLVVNGQTGALKYTINTVQYTNSGLLVTIADVDHDGKAELFLLAKDQHLYCYNYNGGIRWTSANTVDNNYLLSAADVNNDGVAEIVCGRYVFDAQTGALLLQGNMVETGMGFGAPHGVHLPNFHIPYYMYALGDVDGDGTLELCAGNTVYKMVITNNAGTVGNSWSILRQADAPGIANKDGQTFLVDFDNDGDFDVCVIGVTHSLSQSTTSHTVNIYVWDGQTSQLIAHNTRVVNSKFGTSIPYSGDLNGDGYPEIIFAVPSGMLAYTYNPVTFSMDLMHQHSPFAETSGFTVFDFNQDGRNEIVYRGATQLFIADGVTLQNLCPPTTSYSGTITEYPIVADVNADGHAEIIVTRAYNDWNAGGGAEGWVSVYGSQIPGAWSSARKVWNQWAYSSVNINEDMTVPQYRFDVSTTFPNGEKPFNSFLHQMSYLDTQGALFNPVPDVALSTPSAVAQGSDVVLTLDYCNVGGNVLSAPYPIMVFANAYGSDTLCTVTMTENLPVDSCAHQVIVLTNSVLCASQSLEALVVAVNGNMAGIAQNGLLQSECDTTNNVGSVEFHLQNVEPVELNVSACDSYEWNGQIYTESGDYSAVFTRPGSCDSVVTLHLTVSHTPEATVTATFDTICNGEEVTLHVGQGASSGPVLHVPTVAIGDILCTDNSIVKPSNWPVVGKTAMGIVFYVDNTGEHGCAVHLQDQGTSVRWNPGGPYTDVNTLTNYSSVNAAQFDVGGYSNTQKIRAAGDATLFPAAYVVDFANGWYLPALGQLRLLLSEALTINHSLQIVGGGSFPLQGTWGYWSSTENSQGFSWIVYHYGGMYATDKNVLHRVRSIRNF